MEKMSQYKQKLRLINTLCLIFLHFIRNTQSVIDLYYNKRMSEESIGINKHEYGVIQEVTQRQC